MGTVHPIVGSKIEPPMVLPTARDDLLPRISADSRYVAIVAPPGYGKTVLAREIHAACPPGTAAWLSVDLLDRQPFSFWTHLIAALQGTEAEIDDEPMDLVAERPSSDFTFLASLCQQVRAYPGRLALVLDDVDRVDDPDVLAGLEQLGDWCEGHLRLILTGRVDPALPIAKWRAAGLLTQFRQGDLRFDRAASHRFVSTFTPGLLEPADVDALHDRVEGWPVALQVALLVARGADDPSAAARKMAGTDRLLADYLTGEVLDSLTDGERDVALGLSVLEWFDVGLCGDVLGASSVPVVRQLLDRQIPMVELSGGFRFHSLVRELLEVELRWRDPERWAALHRRAGEALVARGDRLAAVRQFVAIDDHDRATEVVAGRAQSLVDEGRIDELRRALAQLPAGVRISNADRAIDLAFAELLIGRLEEAERWVRRAAELPMGDDRVRIRYLAVLISVRTVRGDADTAELVAELDRLRGPSAGDDTVVMRIDGVLARLAVVLELPDVDDRLATLRSSASPQAVLDVIVPALESLRAFNRGDLAAANRLQAYAIGHAEALSSDAHPAIFEALLAAGWCAWADGSFDRARELTDRAFAHPLGSFPQWWLRIATLAADCLVRTGAAPAAIELLGHLRPPVAGYDLMSSQLALARARALLGAHRHDEVDVLLASLPRSPGRDLLMAWAAVGRGRRDAARELLAGAGSWPVQLRIEAKLAESCIVGPAAADALVREAVADASQDGWVAPLLGHDRAITARLRGLPLATLHPRLSVVLAGPGTPRPSRLVVDLTEREMTLLELLPTHLSYSQMGERLYLSVNTIKSNLKSLYRKLDAKNRDEAIRAANEAGLLRIGAS